MVVDVDDDEQEGGGKEVLVVDTGSKAGVVGAPAETETSLCDGKNSSGSGSSSSSGRGGAGSAKKPRGSEDAYMLIYVRRGVPWGPSSAEGGAASLPDDVLVSAQ